MREVKKLLESAVFLSANYDSFSNEPQSAIVILDVPPYGRVKIGDNKRTAFPELDKMFPYNQDNPNCLPQQLQYTPYQLLLPLPSL